MMLGMLRLLADGRPIARGTAQTTLAETGVDAKRIAQFLDAFTQHDSDGAIVGLGLTHLPTAHQITLDQAPPMWAWCALDTLLFTQLLDRSATVESTAPGTHATVRIALDPHGVHALDPAKAVITLPIRTHDDEVDISSIEAIWRTLCHQSYFFATRTDAQHWATDRDDIAIVTVAEGFDIAADMATAVRRNAADGTSKNPDSTSPDQLLRNAIRNQAFRRLLHDRTPVTPSWLAAKLDLTTADATATLTDMAVRGRLRLDDQGAITGAAGLSITPDRHQIDLPSGRYWTWCHYDILGIFGALGADGQAAITEPAPLTLNFRDGRPDATDLVLLLPDDNPLQEDCCDNTYAQWCPHANLFPDTATAQTWANEHGIRARIVPITEAAGTATKEWKPLT